jgi:hypothetical protein
MPKKRKPFHFVPVMADATALRLLYCLPCHSKPLLAFTTRWVMPPCSRTKTVPVWWVLSFSPYRPIGASGGLLATAARYLSSSFDKPPNPAGLKLPSGETDDQVGGADGLGKACAILPARRG